MLNSNFESLQNVTYSLGYPNSPNPILHRCDDIVDNIGQSCVFPFQNLKSEHFLPRPFPLGKDVVNMLWLSWWDA